MNIDNITKGEWKYKDCNGCKDIYIEGKHSIATAFTHGLLDDKEDLANAQLITEAGTVANQCGLSPAQLLEDRNKWLEGFKDLSRKEKPAFKKRFLEIKECKELLQQNKELREALEFLYEANPNGSNWNYPAALAKAEETLSKHPNK